MKKLIILSLIVISLGLCVNSVSAQGSGTIRANTLGYVWGTAADTLIQSDTLDYTFRVRGEHPLDLNFGLYVAKTSGTVTSNFIFAGSMVDSASWYTNIDTIALSNVSTGKGGEVNLDDFNYPYLRVRSITSATAQKAAYQLYYISREE